VHCWRYKRRQRETETAQAKLSLYSKKGTYRALTSFDILTKGSVILDKPFAQVNYTCNLNLKQNSKFNFR
jgi:hypothetical protein